MNQLSILGICGSLRQDSYNKAVLRTIQSLLPESISFTAAEIGDIPLYNGDVETQGFPPSVVTFKEHIAQANGVIIVTPEYNRSIPGGLKNAIDWASRPDTAPTVFAGKPFAITGASDGGFGTVRAQLHLREILSQLGGFVLPKPEVYISKVDTLPVENGLLTDPHTNENLQNLISTFIMWLSKENNF